MKKVSEQLSSYVSGDKRFTKVPVPAEAQKSLQAAGIVSSENWVSVDKTAVAQVAFVEDKAGNIHETITFPLTRVLNENQIKQNAYHFLPLGNFADEGSVYIMADQRVVLNFSRHFDSKDGAKPVDFLKRTIANGAELAGRFRNMIKDAAKLPVDVENDGLLLSVLGKPVKLTPAEMALQAGGGFWSDYFYYFTQPLGGLADFGPTPTHIISAATGLGSIACPYVGAVEAGGMLLG